MRLHLTSAWLEEVGSLAAGTWSNTEEATLLRSKWLQFGHHKVRTGATTVVFPWASMGRVWGEYGRVWTSSTMESPCTVASDASRPVTK